jgi:hypothetical protein
MKRNIQTQSMNAFITRPKVMNWHSAIANRQ